MTLVEKFDPEQPRDEAGRWSAGAMSIADVEDVMDSLQLGDHPFDHAYQMARNALYMRYFGNANAFAVNAALRGTEVTGAEHSQEMADQAKADAKVLVESYDKISLPLDRDIHVFRSIGDPLDKVFPGLKVGDVITDKGFISTSLDPGEASGQPLWPQGRMTISVPQGTKVVAYRDEDEILLRPDTRFEVKSVDPSHTVVSLDVLPSGLGKYSPEEERDDHGRWTAGGAPFEPLYDLSLETFSDLTTYARLSVAEATAVDDYINMGSGPINRSLRAGTAEGLQSTIANLDSAIGRSTLAQDVQLFRGVDQATLDLLKSYPPGSVLSDPAFTSTTASPAKAQEFTKGGMLVINAPKGTPALGVKVSPFSFDDREYEVILPRGTRLGVEGTRGSNLFLRVLPPLKKFDPNQPRDDQGQWTDGGGDSGSGPASFPATFAAAGLKPGTIADLPKGAVKDLKFKETTTSTPELEKAVAAVSAAFKELKDKTGVIGNIRDIVGEEVRFLVGDYAPKEAAMTSVTGNGKALILLNSGLDFAAVGQPPGYAYGAIVAAGMTAAGASRDDVIATDYRYALYHEMGHMLDTASGHEFQAAVVDKIVRAVGQDNSKITSWIETHISPYAATSPAELAAEVSSMYIGGVKLPKELEGLFP